MAFNYSPQPLDMLQGFKQYADYLQQTAKAAEEQQKLQDLHREMQMRPEIARAVGLGLGGGQQPQLPQPPPGAGMAQGQQQNPGMTVSPGQASPAPQRGNQVPGGASGIQGWRQPPQPSPQQLLPQPPVSQGGVQSQGMPQQISLADIWKKMDDAGIKDNEVKLQALLQRQELMGPQDKMALMMMQRDIEMKRLQQTGTLSREKMALQEELTGEKIAAQREIASNRDKIGLQKTMMSVAARMNLGLKQVDLKERAVKAIEDLDKSKMKMYDTLSSQRGDKNTISALSASSREAASIIKSLQSAILKANTQERVPLQAELDSWLEGAKMLDKKLQNVTMGGTQDLGLPEGWNIEEVK